MLPVHAIPPHDVAVLVQRYLQQGGFKDSRAAFERDPRLPNLLLDPEVARVIGKRTAGWRRIVALCVERGIPIPALSASLAYYDSFRSETLHSAQCIQAQRDCFGGHGFKRLDSPGTFHAIWIDRKGVALD